MDMTNEVRVAFIMRAGLINSFAPVRNGRAQPW